MADVFSHPRNTLNALDCDTRLSTPWFDFFRYFLERS